MIPFPERLSALIKAMHVTPTDFGRITDTNRASLTNFLSGKTMPSLSTLERICAADERISADYLLRGKGEPLHEPASPNEMEGIQALLAMQAAIQAQMSQFIEARVTSSRFG